MDDDCNGNHAEYLCKKVYVLTSHLFIFTPGSWLGEGTITLPTKKEKFTFYTLWDISEVDDRGKITCVQKIEMQGVPDHMYNEFSFSDISLRHFSVTLESQSIKDMIGSGIINPEVISWEFRLSHLGFEGFELYQIGPNPETYLSHAEYKTGDDFHVVIHGKVWRKGIIE